MGIPEDRSLHERALIKNAMVGNKVHVDLQSRVVDTRQAKVVADSYFTI